MAAQPIPETVAPAEPGTPPADVPAAITCRVLGSPSIEVRGTRLSGESELMFGLVLYLCVRSGAPTPRDTVARLFWPGEGIEAARHCLRQALYRLRALGVSVNAEGASVELPPASVRVDYHALLQGVPARDVYLAHRRFDVLVDYAPGFSPAFALWIEEFRSRMGLQLRNGLVSCIADARARGRYREVETLAKHCLVLDPLNEEATLGLAEATVLRGNKVEAVALLDGYEREIGDKSAELKVQTSLLRRRIAERYNVYSVAADDVPMVGRDDSLEYLVRLMHECRGGAVRVAGITGEPGIGKTRLALEFARIAALHGMAVVKLRCQQGAQDHPLAAATELAQQFLALPGALGCAPEAMRMVRELTSEMSSDVPYTGFAADGGGTLASLRWAVFDMVDAVLQEVPVLLLIDNVQWLDDLSAAFVEVLLRRCVQRRLFCVLTQRDDSGGDASLPAWAHGTEHVMALRPLSEAASRELALHIAERADRPASGALVTQCVRRGGGNPYFVSELARFYLMEGPEAEAPVSLRQFVAYRMERVASRSRRVLEVCAVLGAFSTVRRVRQVLQLRTTSFLTAIDELDRIGLVAQDGDRCVCRHDIVREIVLRQLTSGVRRILHLRAALVFRREAKVSADPLLLHQCGVHLIASGDTARAIAGAMWLAGRLLRCGAGQRAGELAEWLVEQKLDARRRLRAVGQLIQAKWMEGKWESLIASASEHGMATDSRPRVHSSIEILESCARVRLMAPTQGDVLNLRVCVEDSNCSNVHRLQAATQSVIAAHAAMDPNAARHVATIADTIPAVTLDERIAKHVVAMIFQSEFGDLDIAAAHAEQLVQEAPKLTWPGEQAQALRRASACLMLAGKVDASIALLHRALKCGPETDRAVDAVYTHRTLARLYLQTGRFEESAVHIALLRDLVISRSLPQQDLSHVTYTNCLLAQETNSPHLIDYGILDGGSVDCFANQPRAAVELLTCKLIVMLFGARRYGTRTVFDKLMAAFREAMVLGSLVDSTATVLLEYLCKLGRDDEARALAANYLRARRARCSLIPSLAAKTQQLGIQVNPKLLRGAT